MKSYYTQKQVIQQALATPNLAFGVEADIAWSREMVCDTSTIEFASEQASISPEQVMSNFMRKVVGWDRVERLEISNTWVWGSLKGHPC